MIKVKLVELNAILEGFNELIEITLPVKVAYYVSKNVKKVVSEIKDFEENRVKLAQKYAKKDKDGVPLIEDNQFVMEDMQGFNKEFVELANIDVEFDFPALTIEQFGNSEVKPSTIIKLGPFIEE